VAREVENYHNLNRKNTIPIYVEGSKYYSLFEPLVNIMKIDCRDYLITYNGWHGFETRIQVKKDKFDSQTVKRQANQLADIINFNTIFMNVIDDLHHLKFIMSLLQNGKNLKLKVKNGKIGK